MSRRATSLIVLLYKSKNPRPIDDADFAAIQPVLDDEAGAWLRAALALSPPNHPRLRCLFDSRG